MKNFFLVLLCTSLAWAAQPTAPVDLITESSIKSDMFFLANDDMKGRDATSPEDRISADYIASEFMRLGLKPVGDDGTYFQDFDMVVGPLDPAHTMMKAKLDGTEKTFQMGHDFNYFFVQSANPTEVTAPLVFAGYGVNAPEYKYNDYAGVDVHGKVVLVLDREPQPNDPNSRFKGRWDTVHSYMWYKIAQAHKAGVAGLLVVPDRTRRKQLKRLVPTNGEAGPSPQFALAGNFLDIPVFMITAEVANELLAPSGEDLVTGAAGD
jgi:PA domain